MADLVLVKRHHTTMNLGGLIPLLGGIYCLLIGFRVVRASKNPDANETYVKKYGLLLKVGGVVCVVFGVIELFRLL
jgi:hypothetical protein